jgi:hypothetical protein
LPRSRSGIGPRGTVIDSLSNAFGLGSIGRVDVKFTAMLRAIATRGSSAPLLRFTMKTVREGGAMDEEEWEVRRRQMAWTAG